MKEIAAAVEVIAGTVEKNLDILKTEQAIKAARELLKRNEHPELIALDVELATWQSKLSVILKEPVGRKGMAKHARHWAEKLKSQK